MEEFETGRRNGNFNENTESQATIISAKEIVGIPRKQVENTILLLSKENAAVHNRKVLIDDRKFNLI